MSDVCLNCGGAIFGPQDGPVGYAGPICHCPVDPKTQYRRPSKEESLEVEHKWSKEDLEMIEKARKEDHERQMHRAVSNEKEKQRVAKEEQKIVDYVESLKSKLAIAVSALEKIANGVDESLLLDEKLADAWTDLLNLVKEARQALKEIGGGG